MLLTNWLIYLEGDQWSMSDAERRRGRGYDAESAREAILNAAEETFASEGFDGARIDAIAAASGYNKSLIFHYFEDKLSLYVAVIRRMKEHGESLQMSFLKPLMESDTILHDAREFRRFLEQIVGESFDFLQSHPKFLRILSWEAAEQWKTFTQIITRLDLPMTKRLQQLFLQAQTNGILRSDIEPVMTIILTLSMCQSYLTSLPRYEVVLDQHLSSPEALARARKQIVRFVVHGMMADNSYS
jgi:AcrR family transcriptional regulator